MVNVATYHSVNANPNQAWIGYVILSNGDHVMVRFIGASEQAVIDRATSWYEMEKARQLQLAGKLEADMSQLQTGGSIPQGRGQNFLGSVWVINKSTGHKTRIAASELAGYEANGYQKGGPRS